MEHTTVKDIDGRLMETCVSQLQKSALFSEIGEDDIQKIRKCIVRQERKVKKGDYIFRTGDEVRWVYLIVSGSMHIINEDFWGNLSLIETMEAGTVFGEAYVLAQEQYHLVSVVAANDSLILEIDPSKMLAICKESCVCHTKLVKNITYILSTKIVRLTGKVRHITQRTTRQKLCSYLSRCARQEQSNSFDIPYSRQQLADYLHVDRSALSHELSVMRDLKIVKYHKNHFELLS
jgi:cAMP-binding proteins - catabolite gene activator and regulatory subunit of cAMP-dependent protein kinases